MSDKHDVSWVFGKFLTYPERYPDSPKPSQKWHIAYNRYMTYCNKEKAGVEIRAWTAGPPDGEICAICARYFERASGLEAKRASILAAADHA